MSEPTMPDDLRPDEKAFRAALDALIDEAHEVGRGLPSDDGIKAARRAVLDLHQRRIAEAKAEVLGELRAKLQKEIDWDMESYGASGKDWRGGVRLAINQIDALLNQKGGE